ncbi:MAG: tRNA lysidine(34) synthetase TilS [Acidobacteriia bacterium]|nr:tRNA lysidine(34) synthetase TilS [Terriglobia bacterium]
MKSLEQRLLETIRTSRLLSPGDRVGVAVSGGADSVALLRLLERLREPLGITLAVVHFDHGLRGAESDADAQFVAEVARMHDLPLIFAREDVAGVAAARKWNLEDAARRLRYAFFERVVAAGQATHIAVAHTADDQAETVLAHLLRGTGPTGLAGIYPVVGSVVRPLLGERRDDLRKYLRDLGQDWREDSSNLDLRRLRARIRQRLLPLLETEFSDHAVAHLAGLARLAREEEQFWTALVEDRFRALVHENEGRLIIRIGNLLAPLALSSGEPHAGATPGSAAPAAQRALTERLIRRLYQGVRGELRGLSARHVEQVMRLASVSTGARRVELPHGIVVERTFDDLIVSGPASAGPDASLPETTRSPREYQYVVDLPARGAATVSVPELGSRFRLKVIDWPILARDTKREVVALDADLLAAPLILRNWRPGDAYRPRGRRHALKLKEMFLARHIPSRERGSWPVLVSGGRVAWVRGMAPAEEFCARKGARAGVVIEEDRF